MKIVELKCPNCGAKLDKIDKKNAVCNHCGSVFVIKEIQKEQKKTVGADGTLQTRILGWLALIGLVFGIFGLFALAAYFRTESSEISVGQIEVEKEEEQWSAFFEAFLEEVYCLPIEKISTKQLEEMTHLKIFFEKDCKVAEYRMEDGELLRLEFSGELNADYSDAGRVLGLKSLDVGTWDFSDGDLVELEKLTEIWCGNTPEELLSIVKAPEKITVMGCYWTGTVAMVDRFKNLERLHIESPGLSDGLTDISALGALENLKELELIKCDAVTDFGVLHSLAGLEKLIIDSENLKDISFVEKMDSLSCLKIEDSMILDVSPLWGKASLVELTLLDNYDITDYSALSSLTELEKLDLELCSVSDVPDVSAWNKLKELTIRDAGDIRFLEKLPQLECLYIIACDCSEYEVLGTLNNVEELKLSGVYGDIPGLDVLYEMDSLNSLDISGMSLYGNVENIFGIPTLEKLDVSDCSFGLDFDAMPSNDNLKILNMNRLQLWENIQVDYDGAITYLDYDDVLLKDHAEVLGNFPNLEELYMQGNKMTELEFTSALPKLKKLDFTGNYITDMRPLKNLEHLEIVWCGENAVSQGMDLGEDVIVIGDSKMDERYRW